MAGARHSSLADRSQGTWHDECPAVSRPQMPPADDRRNGDTRVSQVRRRHQTVMALEGDHSQLKRDSLTYWKQASENDPALV